jgi:hypothetical protein
VGCAELQRTAFSDESVVDLSSEYRGQAISRSEQLQRHYSCPTAYWSGLARACSSVVQTMDQVVAGDISRYRRPPLIVPP